MANLIRIKFAKAKGVKLLLLGYFLLRWLLPHLYDCLAAWSLCNMGVVGMATLRP